MGEVEAGFAKLQGEDFEYYMQNYSIILGRNSKKSEVDIDLSDLGGGMNISRQHARIFYDFERKRFSLEVMGKNGCDVRGTHYIPGDPPVKLGSQDLVQMGELQFYFLLPSRTTAKQGVPLSTAAASPGGLSRKRGGRKEDEYDVDSWQEQQSSLKKGRFQGNQDGMRSGRNQPVPSWSVHELQNPYMVPKKGIPYRSDQKGDSRRRGDHETDMFQQMQSEEKDVVSAVATVLSDLCGPGEWMPMAKLHSEGLEAEKRADAVNSMVYEARARVEDPVHGCANKIYHMKKRIAELQAQLTATQEQLVNMRLEYDKLVFLLGTRSDDAQDVHYPTHTTSKPVEDIMYDEVDPLLLWGPLWDL